MRATSTRMTIRNECRLCVGRCVYTCMKYTCDRFSCAYHFKLHRSRLPCHVVYLFVWSIYRSFFCITLLQWSRQMCLCGLCGRLVETHRVHISYGICVYVRQLTTFFSWFLFNIYLNGKRRYTQLHRVR